MKSKLILLFALLLLGLQANAHVVNCQSGAVYRIHGELATVSPAVRPPLPHKVGSPCKAAPVKVDREESRPPHLSHYQNQALAEAWHAGYHVGLPLAFTAIVYVESSGCAKVRSDTGIAFGCSQVQVRTAYDTTGAHIPAWMLSDPNLRTVNMAIGARYLQMCVDRFGWPVGAGCYEQGIPRTRILQRKGCFRVRVERIKPCREVRRYMASVLAAMIWLRNLSMSEE